LQSFELVIQLQGINNRLSIPGFGITQLLSLSLAFEMLFWVPLCMRACLCVRERVYIVAIFGQD